MDYLSNYNNYINFIKSKNRTLNNSIQYYEIHHIIPLCCSGTGERKYWKTHKNLVLLTAREHFLAHYLLCKIYKNTPDYYKLLCAFNYLSSNGKYKNSRLYEKMKIEKSILQSQRPPWNKGLTGLPKHHTNLGRKQTPEEIERRRLANTGRKRTPEQIENIKRGIGDKWKIGIEKCVLKTRKKIICVETGQIFESYWAAAKTLHLSLGNISGVVHGYRKHTKGLTFKEI